MRTGGSEVVGIVGVGGVGRHAIVRTTTPGIRIRNSEALIIAFTILPSIVIDAGDA